MVRFGAFTLDARRRQLLDGVRPVHLSPKAFDLLAMLVAARGAAVSKADIHRRLWPDTFVSDGSLAVVITEIRDALRDEARQPKFVRTMHRFGYAFIAATDADAAAAPPLACWISRDDERTRLRAGENVVGRDPAAAVCVDALGVSRRHAVIVVSECEATLRDLGSKNGTFADDVRVTSPVVLRDRTRIRLGPVVLQFRQSTDMPPTQTLDALPTRGLPDDQ